MTSFHQPVAPEGQSFDVRRVTTELPFAALLRSVDGNADPSRDPGVALIGANSFDNYANDNDQVPPNASYGSAGNGQSGGTDS
jgi:hypothetical protein